MSEGLARYSAALARAAELGMRCYDDTARQGEAIKAAILVLSFGTTYAGTRAKTIDTLVAEIQAEYPGIHVVSALTSHLVVRRIREREGIYYPLPEEALQQLLAAGYNSIAMITTDVLPGIEYHYALELWREYSPQTKRMVLGTPLMYWQGQRGKTDDVGDVMRAVSKVFPPLGRQDAVLLLAHGSPHLANAYHGIMQLKLWQQGWPRAFVYTVEGWPRLDDVIPQLRQQDVRHVTLLPLMLVAGNHACQDMAGAEEDSHKSQLEAQGFAVDAYLHGMGENPVIRSLYRARVRECWSVLQREASE